MKSLPVFQLWWQSKRKRKKEDLTLNIAESDDSVAANRKKHDIDNATEILQRYIGITATVKNATRIGKKLTDKARLLKITLNSEDDEVTILRNCTKLRNKNHPDDIRKSFYHSWSNTTGARKK